MIKESYFNSSVGSMKYGNTKYSKKY
jgi:hypothetical protein